MPLRNSKPNPLSDFLIVTTISSKLESHVGVLTVLPPFGATLELLIDPFVLELELGEPFSLLLLGSLFRNDVDSFFVI